MDLLDEERAKYEKVWALADYRRANHGLRLWQQHRDIFPASPHSALDIGCGNGRLFAQWNREGIDGHGVDFAANAPDAAHPNADKFSLQCLWTMELDRIFDLGCCTDVMEHIPPTEVDAVLTRIARHCRIVIFKIANYLSQYGDGKLHLTLHTADWWLAKLSEYGTAELLTVEGTCHNEYVFRLTTGADQ
jgi:2-polyprenyl-3-methyl-5-hydroxy-6-metoxy-1,4-benzoquinol methylase